MMQIISGWFAAVACAITSAAMVVLDGQSMPLELVTDL